MSFLQRLRRLRPTVPMAEESWPLTYEERLRAVGDRLAQARQEQGLDLEKLASRVRVRPALLVALEQGNASVLPEPVYVRGLVQRYGTLLGLEAPALLTLLTGESATPAAAVIGGSWRSNPTTGVPTWQLYVLYLVLVLVLVNGLTWLVNRAALRGVMPEPPPVPPYPLERLDAPAAVSEVASLLRLVRPLDPAPDPLVTWQALMTPVPKPTPEAMAPTPTDAVPAPAAADAPAPADTVPSDGPAAAPDPASAPTP
jgi:cytoskeletal protein RodZ